MFEYLGGAAGGGRECCVAVDELCEATSGVMRHPDAAVVKPTSTVYQAYRVYRFYDRYALERSLAQLVNCYGVAAA